MKKHMLLCLACGWLMHCHANAQSIGPSIVGTTGGFAFSNGNNFNWSVGEMTMVATFTGSNIIVTQGVLQPHPVPTSVAIINANNAGLRVYPNPASDMVMLAANFNRGGKLSVVLHDITGRLLMDQSFTLTAGNEVQQLDVHTLPPGSYTLSVLFSDGRERLQYGFNIQVVK
ncbi:MAG: Secretion system C-terminal sorting domain [Flavipsychrobacter sp.]|jgi:hypothetical protein|nr:Secretion system C-terminal sorting domain [Flavipsychrobacter sp.]